MCNLSSTALEQIQPKYPSIQSEEIGWKQKIVKSHNDNRDQMGGGTYLIKKKVDEINIVVDRREWRI